MPTSLVLHQMPASGPLVPARFVQALAQAQAQRTTGGARGTMKGQLLRLSLGLGLDDDACTAFQLEFLAQGGRVRGTARGPSALLFAWAFHLLAQTTGAALEDEDGKTPITPRPDALRDAALAYLAAYEDDVKAARRVRGDAAAETVSGEAFLRWLAREEHVALEEDPGAVAALGAALPMEDASALYEQLLDADAVAEVFVGESELAALLARFRARRPGAA